jgi:hypothetical protein
MKAIGEFEGDNFTESMRAWNHCQPPISDSRLRTSSIS